MKNKSLYLLLAAVLLPVFVSSCALFGNNGSDELAIIGGGAVAGKDYVLGLKPSEGARDYFSDISEGRPIETVRRTDEKESKSGVRFVSNGGILIPPGVTISFENHGYCMDPHLPAPKAGEEFQLVPMSRLIPDELQGTYKNLIAQEGAGNSAVRANMQHLVWALRTAGTDAAYANNLTSQEKQILNQCSNGLFESFHEREKISNKLINDLLSMADSVLNVKIGGVTYKASDLLDPDIANKKIEEHLNQLIDLSEFLPVENVGLNFGEIQQGIYTDVHGSGSLAYHARIANSTSQPFIFYPSDYVGQVGSPAKRSGLFAAADSSMRQRVTGMNQDKVNVVGISHYDENKYDIHSGDLSGRNIFNTPNDLINMVKRVSTEKEVVGEIYKEGRDYYVTNFNKIGDSGGTRPALSNEAVAGIHSHPVGGDISPADIASVLTTGKPELIVDPSTGNVYILREREARQAWNKISEIYKEQTGYQIPAYQDVSSDGDLVVNVDKAILDYRDNKRNEIISRRDARKEELKNREYRTQREVDRVNKQWEREEQAFKKEYEDCNHLGSIPLTNKNKWNGRGL